MYYEKSNLSAFIMYGAGNGWMSVFYTHLDGYKRQVYRSAIQGLGNTLIPLASGIAEFVMRVSVALLLSLIHILPY